MFLSSEKNFRFLRTTKKPFGFFTPKGRKRMYSVVKICTEVNQCLSHLFHALCHRAMCFVAKAFGNFCLRQSLLAHQINFTVCTIQRIKKLIFQPVIFLIICFKHIMTFLKSGGSEIASSSSDSGAPSFVRV